MGKEKLILGILAGLGLGYMLWGMTVRTPTPSGEVERVSGVEAILRRLQPYQYPPYGAKKVFLEV